MKNKIEIRSIFGRVLFTYEAENATIKDAVEQAVKEKVSLALANLSSADLSSAENKEIANLPIFCKWSHSIVGNEIQIGCKSKTIEEWDEFFSSEKELETKRGTKEFKQIQAVYESYKAYLIFLNNEN